MEGGGGGVTSLQEGIFFGVFSETKYQNNIIIFSNIGLINSDKKQFEKMSNSICSLFLISAVFKDSTTRDSKSKVSGT